LINLQRDSDHHYKPDRPYPLLQTHPSEAAPQLAFGYPTIVMMVMFPVNEPSCAALAQDVLSGDCGLGSL